MTRVFASLAAANLVWFDELDSTHALALRLVDHWVASGGGELADTLIVAGRQTAGRGRGSNRWESPAGGLYATWLGWVPTEVLSGMPLAVGVALAGAVEDLVPGISVRLKWPNDLVVGGRKLGGVLIQARGDGLRTWVVVGFGVNLETEPVLAEESAWPPVALASLGWRGDVGDATRAVLAAFLPRLRAALVGVATRHEWEARLVHRDGDTLRVRLHDRELHGVFAGLGADGQLRVRVDGEVVEVASGEVIGRLAGGEE